MLMAVASAADLVDFLHRRELLDPGRLDFIEADSDSGAIGREIQRRGWLTRFQIREILQGRGERLFVGPYLILEPLGEGGMGRVFRARHRLMGRPAALKLLRPDLLKDPSAVRRFLREAQAAGRLAHANLVTLFDAGQAEGHPYLAMELVEGNDLAMRVREDGPLPIAQARAYLRQAAEGLRHAHEQGLVHRDIKPSNLLVSRDGTTVKILDLGLARLDKDDATEATLTRDGAVLGTLDYISPEQAKDAKAADARSDLYSLGCTFYHLLAGHPPFPGDNGINKLMQHQLDEPEPLRSLRPDAPADLAAIVHRLMSKNPDDRFASAAALLQGLDGAEVIADVEEVPQEPAPTVVTPPGARALSPIPVAQPVAPTVIERNPFQELTPGIDPPASPNKKPKKRPVRRVLTSVLLVAFGGGALFLIAVAAILAGLAHRDQTPPPATEPEPSAERRVSLPLEMYLAEESVVVLGMNPRALDERPVIRKHYREAVREAWSSNEEVRKGLDALGINPAADIDRVLIAWDQRSVDKSLVLARGRFYPEKFRTRPAVRSHEVIRDSRRYTYYEFRRDPQPSAYFGLLDETTLAVSLDTALVLDSVERAAGRAPPAGPKDAVVKKLLAEVDGDADLWLVGRSDVLARGAGMSMNVFVRTTLRDLLRGSVGVRADLTFTDDITADAVFFTKDADSAAKLHKQVEDARLATKALLNLFAVNQKDLVPLLHALEGGRVKTAGQTVHFTARFTAADIDKAMRK
jgi:serine/threonine-protein kinase